MSTTAKTVEAAVNREYEWGFVTDIEADAIAPGLNEDIIRLISSKKNEPEFMLEWRLPADRHLGKMDKGAGGPPRANAKLPPIRFQAIVSYQAPTQKTAP